MKGHWKGSLRPRRSEKGKGSEEKLLALQQLFQMMKSSTTHTLLRVRHQGCFELEEIPMNNGFQSQFKTPCLFFFIFREQLSSFHYADPRDRTQAIRFGGNLAGPWIHTIRRVAFIAILSDGDVVQKGKCAIGSPLQSNHCAVTTPTSRLLFVWVLFVLFSLFIF